MEQLLQYATKRIVELENLLLVEVMETVWPAEMGWYTAKWKNAVELLAQNIFSKVYENRYRY